MNPHQNGLDHETRISEITIMPNGQIYVFGMSRQVLELLDDLNFGDRSVRQRREHLRTLELADPRQSAEQKSRVGGESRVDSRRRQ